jgi:FkbM family methyltransferase
MNPINTINTVLDRFGVRLIRSSTLKAITASAISPDELAILTALPERHLRSLLQYRQHSKSQFRQDLFALCSAEFKRDGYFVDFGATNGLEGSNSHILEKEFSWDGIVAEPARCWHEALQANRNCHIETACVWADSNTTLQFAESVLPALSTIHSFIGSDHWEKDRQKCKTYDVQTISLTDLLEKYHAPSEIDFLSIDTEGSEYEILRNFDFSRYRFRAITCEHNYGPIRQQIYRLLSDHGYRRVHESISQVDDWYIWGGPTS